MSLTRFSPMVKQNKMRKDIIEVSKREGNIVVDDKTSQLTWPTIAASSSLASHRQTGKWMEFRGYGICQLFVDLFSSGMAVSEGGGAADDEVQEGKGKKKKKRGR